MISLAGHMAHFGLEFIITFLFILANVFVTIEMGIIGNAPVSNAPETGGRRQRNIGVAITT